MKDYSRVLAKIDLDAIEWNMDQMKHHIAADTKIMNVIKADGYGHGATYIAQMMKEKDYIWGFAVATFDEAMVLRNNGITHPILVLGCVFEDQIEELIKHNISMTVYDKTMCEYAAKVADRLGLKLRIHIKIDTGMGRLGFFADDSSILEIKSIHQLKSVVMEGMYTHFSKADEEDKGYTKEQIEAFSYMKNRLQNEGVVFQYYHTSNSAGIIDIKEANYDLVRTGISCYGLYPSLEVNRKEVILKPAMSLISHVVSLKWFERGKAISYGGTYTTTKKTHIAVIPVGYADGYARSLSNKGYVLIRGKEAPIVGRICMDQFMVDVTRIEDVALYDRVTLIGTDDTKTISVETLSRLSGRFNYEFVCDIGKRIPREYIRNKKIISQKDYFY